MNIWETRKFKVYKNLMNDFPIFKGAFNKCDKIHFFQNQGVKNDLFNWTMKLKMRIFHP